MVLSLSVLGLLWVALLWLVLELLWVAPLWSVLELLWVALLLLGGLCLSTKPARGSHHWGYPIRCTGPILDRRCNRRYYPK